MPRKIFPAGTLTATGAPQRMTFHVTSTSTRRETDLYALDGSNNLAERIPNGVVVADSTGAYSAFAGPDDIDTLYAVINSSSGARTTFTATGVVASSAAVSYASGVYVDSTSRAAFLKTTSSTAHAATVYQAGTSGVDVAAALNVVSDNPQSSAMYLSGKETNRGTLKIAHRGDAGGADSNAAAISVDLQNAGTAAQGLFITSTTGPTTGDLVKIRNGGSDLFNIKAGGQVLLGDTADLSAPAGGAYVRSVAGVVKVISSTGADFELVRPAALPSDHGLTAWSYDVSAAVNGSVVVAGTVQFVRIKLAKAASITNVCLYVTTAGSTLTSGQNFAALYTGAGVLLDTTADQTTAWGTTGAKTMALSGGATARAAGDYLVAFWSNGSTPASFARSAGSAVGNFGLTGTSSRYGTANTGVTTTSPAPLTGMTAGSVQWWAGLS